MPKHEKQTKKPIEQYDHKDKNRRKKSSTTGALSRCESLTWSNHTMEPTKIAVFKGKQIRKTLHDNEWWFVIEDVVSALTDSNDPKQYVQRMKQRDPVLAEGWVQFVHTLGVKTEGGSQRMNCANTEAIFRIIQSIPSPKAEPFKRWLARVGYECVQEIEDPELGTKRTRALYKAKGYSDAWIEKRMRGIAIRDELTDEWKKRGVKEGAEYAILTAEISKATFGLFLPRQVAGRTGTVSFGRYPASIPPLIADSLTSRAGTLHSRTVNPNNQ